MMMCKIKTYIKKTLLYSVSCMLGGVSDLQPGL